LRPARRTATIPTVDRGCAHSLLARAKQRTISRIADPDLSPAIVAEASFVSVRQLHRLFAADGTTFGTFLREERLRRCRADLADPRLEHEPGSRSPAHFSRLFTARYGITPRAFRRASAERRTRGAEQ
jgi:AraC-like DNA-binding protein